MEFGSCRMILAGCMEHWVLFGMGRRGVSTPVADAAVIAPAAVAAAVLEAALVGLLRMVGAWLLTA